MKQKPTYEELERRIAELEHLLADKPTETERALRANEELLTLFMKHSPIYAFIKEVTPTESRVIMASENYIDMIGIPGSEMVGKNMEQLFPPEFALKITADDWSVVADGQILNLEETLNEKQYTTIKYPISLGNKNLLAGYTIDITSLKHAEQEIVLKNEELVHLIAEKDRFFSIMAHDLRSPFNAFLGLTRIMVEDLPLMSLKEIEKMAVSMSESATTLYLLLENLLEWSRFQRGMTKFDPKPLLLMPVIEESLSSVMESAIRKGLDFNYDIPETLMVMADKFMLGSILRNLVSNAMKFTPSGGRITLTARSKKAGTIDFSVADTGIGIPAKMLEKLFHLDENVSRRGTEGEPSTGLGLILCKDFIEKHGGTIWAESLVSQGSTFHFTLPGR